MKVLLVAGARPNFMKVAPLLHALRARQHEVILVHTGQHYDEQMSAAFFRELDLPDPDAHLGVGSGSHAQQTARVMSAFEPVLVRARPDWVVVVGDINSTLACALVTAKLRYEIGCRLAHVEAGLRSGDWRMPEEVNRVLTDRLADLLLTPSRDAASNLSAEGIAAERVVFAGNVMIDTLRQRLPAARALHVPAALGLPEKVYAVVTLHRPSNVDEAAALTEILRGLIALSAHVPVVFPVHPRTVSRIDAIGLREQLAALQLIDPLDYTHMLSLTASAAIVLTDSGGLQEETTALGIPCLTLREQTERPVTVEQGTNRLVPWPMTGCGIRDAALEMLHNHEPKTTVLDGWDGYAAERVVSAIETALARKTL